MHTGKYGTVLCRVRCQWYLYFSPFPAWKFCFGDGTAGDGPVYTFNGRDTGYFNLRGDFSALAQRQWQKMGGAVLWKL